MPARRLVVRTRGEAASTSANRARVATAACLGAYAPRCGHRTMVSSTVRGAPDGCRVLRLFLMSSRRPPFDAWGHHPTAFSPHALEVALQTVGLTPGGLAVDPFTGSGRSATALVGHGDCFFGLEAHPLAADLAQVKLSRPGPSQELRQAATEVAQRAERASEQAAVDAVLTRFVPPFALSQLTRLRATVAEQGGPWEGHLRWLLLGALRRHSGSGWPYPRPRGAQQAKPPSQLFLDGAQAMADDLATAARQPRGRVVCADARAPESWLGLAPGSASGCVSSPPYLNQVSYTEALRLEVHLLGWADSWAQMSALGAGLVASCTQQVGGERFALAQRWLASRPGIEAAVRSLCQRLSHAQNGLRRPKRYDRLLVAYFADIGQVLQALLPMMAPGARAAWVVGDSAPYNVYVDTPALLGVLATELGFEVLDDVTLRERGRRWPGSGSRHSRRLSERLLVFRRPAWGEQLELPLAA